MSEAGPGPVSMPSRHRNSPARHTVQDTPSPCTPQAGPASLCSPCRTGILLPIFVRRRSPSQAAQVPQPSGAGPFSRGTPAPPIQHPRFPAAQVLQEKTDLRRDAPGLAPGCPRTYPGQLGGPRHTTAFPAVTGLWHRCGSRRGGEDGEMSLVPCHDGTLAPLWVLSRRGRRRNEPSSLP